MKNRKCRGLDCAWCTNIECPNEDETEMTDKKNNFEKDINVPSKEQTNDSLKNSDKNFNENCAHDKEQIIIDGIDVSECDHFREGYCHPGTGVCYKCDTNCQYAAFYLKEQLARKTQECEELKSESFTREELISLQEKDIDRYRKALEKIEGLVKNFCKDCDDYENCNWDKEGCYYSLIPNLKDIINKVKGEINE